LLQKRLDLRDGLGPRPAGEAVEDGAPRLRGLGAGAAGPDQRAQGVGAAAGADREAAVGVVLHQPLVGRERRDRVAELLLLQAAELEQGVVGERVGRRARDQRPEHLGRLGVLAVALEVRAAVELGLLGHGEDEEDGQESHPITLPVLDRDRSPSRDPVFSNSYLWRAPCFARDPC